MLALRHSSGLFRATLRQHIIPRANISAKPAKYILSTGEQMIGMMTMFVTILVPSGWVLANMENYKKRP